jgi:NADPH-dependent 7-cyano-7-deazaguanine reductase QueF-like protein
MENSFVIARGVVICDSKRWKLYLTHFCRIVYKEISVIKAILQYTVRKFEQIITASSFSVP